MMHASKVQVHSQMPLWAVRHPSVVFGAATVVALLRCHWNCTASQPLMICCTIATAETILDITTFTNLMANFRVSAAKYLLLQLQAPVVAHGNDLVYWDTNNARALVNARGMEYQNHWGAHDPDVELPSEQLNAFFGTRAEYWTPSAKSQAPQGRPQQPPGHPSGHLTHSAGQLHNQAGPARAVQRQAGKETAVPSAASKSENPMGNVRAQRAADRAHNEAVIASTDEQVAQALADEEAQVSW